MQGQEVVDGYALYKAISICITIIWFAVVMVFFVVLEVGCGAWNVSDAKTVKIHSRS